MESEVLTGEVIEIGSLIGVFFAMFFIACLIVVGGCMLLMGIIKLINQLKEV